MHPNQIFASEKLEEEGVERVFIRGASVWVQRDGMIECYRFHPKYWEYTKYTEKDPPPVLTCPIKWLNETEPVNPEWREKVLSNHRTLNDRRIMVGELFKNKKENEFVMLILAPIKKKHKLNVQCLHMVKLGKNGITVYARDPKDRKLYIVPIKYIKEAKIIQKEYGL
jgi:hypothetical protein